MNNSRDPRFAFRTILLPILVSVLVAGCIVERANIAKDATTQLIGKSRDDILACAGPPKTTIRDGDLEYFAYTSGNPNYDEVLGIKPTDAQRITGASIPKNCTARFVFRNGYVESVSYVGNTGGVITRGEACAPIVRHCVSPSSD